MTKTLRTRIPLWVNIMQAGIITVQVLEHFFNHDALEAAGFSVEGDPSLNLIYEMGSRLAVMVIISIFVMITQNPLQYLVVLIMNVAREGSEMFIDPLFPVADAPASPAMDFWIHVVIVAIEIAALVAVLKVIRSSGQPIRQASSA